MISKIKHLFERFFSFLKDSPALTEEFGSKVCFYIMLQRVFFYPKNQKYRDVIYKYTEAFLSPLAEKYKKGDYEKTQPKIKLSSTPIWVCWLQGEEAMPELVRVCCSSLKRNKPENTEIHLITLDNIRDYADIPGYIWDKFNKGIIKPVALSDIIRVTLLSVYGGMWIDSTVFVSGKIPSEFFENNFYSMRMPAEKCPLEACEGRWTGFMFSGKSENSLFSFVRDAFFLWWKEHNNLIEYVILDYFLLTAYRNIESIKNDIDAVPYNNINIWGLKNNLSNPFDEEIYKKITSENTFHKLAHQVEYPKETEKGIKTFYGYIYDIK